MTRAGAGEDTGERMARLGTGSAMSPGYAPGRTLPLRVEAVRQFKRRRTMVMFGLLLALPWILVVAFALGPAPSRPGTLRLSDLATQGGLNFAAFVLSVSATLLLVVAVALFCGDTVASEANWSSLRYLLAAPVPRDRLLRHKLIVALGYSAVAVIALPLMALLAGTAAFGWNDVQLPGTGDVIPAAAVLPRFGIVIGYALVSQLVVAALAFLLSVSTDSPLGAVGGAVGLVIVSNILQAVEALGALREFLPTFWNTAWLDALVPELDWSGMIRGTALSVTYAAILIALAFRRFRRKDIVS
jgi:ABC-2 type transport system permease protein